MKEYIIFTAVVFILVLLSLFTVNSHRLNQSIKSDMENILNSSEPRDNRTFSEDDLENLPQPTADYFKNVLEKGQSYINNVSLEQSGKFRVNDSWKSFSATQQYSVEPPEFIWNAKIDFFPLMPVRVIDMYKEGEGTLQAKLLSTITVSEAGPSPEMNSAELARYLSEAVWFPTALLPTQGVEWESVDENTARATINNQEAEASLLFHFNEHDQITKIHTEERYRQEDNSFQPWTGYFENYQTVEGMKIPMDGKVEWNLPEGNEPYWKGHIQKIEYSF